jgi:uncharacterized protein YyaL (SSP411 family)
VADIVARPLLGRGPGRPVHDGRRRRSTGRAPEGPPRLGHAVGQLAGRRRLARLSAVTGEPRYRNHADQILRLGAGLAAGAPSAFSYLLAAVDMRRASITEIAVAGPRPDLVAAVHQRYLPDAVLAWGERFDSPLWDERRDGFAYVCHDYACEAPTDTVDGLVALLA